MTMTAPEIDHADETVLDEDEPQESHYVRKDDHARGYITGDPIMALCGKVWVPSRDPDRYPLCQECKKIKGQIMAARQGAN